MKKNELNHSSEYCIDILKDYAKNLSLTLEEHSQSLVERLGDYFTIDIATEWDYKHFEYFINILLKEKKISQRAVELIKIIIKRFQEISYEEKVVWTLEGLKSHPFWEEQRELAKKLLKELEQKNIEM